MAIALAIFGFAFAAFFVWLTAHFVNRRERWAQRTLVTMLVLACVAYPLSIGPLVWLVTRGYFSGDTTDFFRDSFYGPVTWLYDHGPAPFPSVIQWYAGLWR